MTEVNQEQVNKTEANSEEVVENEVVASSEAKKSSYVSKDDKIKSTIKRLKQLEPYKNTPDQELHQIALDLLALKETEAEMEITQRFKSKEEKQLAQKLLKKYLQDYTIETISDKNTLKNLIYLEVLNVRLEDKLNDIHSETKASPKEQVKTIHENIQEITELKEKLGITRQKEQQLHQNKDPLAYLYLLLKKRKKWLEQNQASRYMTCPHCGKSVLLKIKTDVWEAQKHPFFKDRILGNDHLVELYRQGKLTKKDLALIFETSEDYVEWLSTKWNLASESVNTDANKEQKIKLEKSNKEVIEVVPESKDNIKNDDVSQESN